MPMHFVHVKLVKNRVAVTTQQSVKIYSPSSSTSLHQSHKTACTKKGGAARVAMRFQGGSNLNFTELTLCVKTILSNIK